MSLTNHFYVVCTICLLIYIKKILTLEININIENEILFLHTENSRQHPIHVNASHYEVGISIRRQFSLSIRYRE